MPHGHAHGHGHGFSRNCRPGRSGFRADHSLTAVLRMPRPLASAEWDAHFAALEADDFCIIEGYYCGEERAAMVAAQARVLSRWKEVKDDPPAGCSMFVEFPVRRCHCIVVPLTSRLSHCRCLAFPLPSRLRQCLPLRGSSARSMC